VIQAIKNTALVKWHQDYQTVFSTPQGRRVLSDLVRTANVDRSTYVTGDSHQTAFNEGKRAIVMRILNRLHVSPEEVIRISKEIVVNE